jgi:hypothetical protein
MGKSAKKTVKTPETSMGNEHHCRGEKPKNQTQGRAPKKVPVDPTKVGVLAVGLATGLRNAATNSPPKMRL